MIVVFDTNVWKESLYLRGGAAAAVQFYLHQKDAKVGLPEVVRLEVERHLRADMRSARDRITSDYERLLSLVGSLRELILPDDNTIDATVSGFISSLGFHLVEVPFSFGAAKSSFLRTIDKVPPSHKSQQFKDGVLWADCLSLANADEIILVTNDHAFYERDDPAKGLANALKADCAKVSHKITVLPTLSKLLEEIVEKVTVADAELADAIDRDLDEQVNQFLERLGFAVTGERKFQKTFYATEVPSSLYVEFEQATGCVDTSGAGRTDAKLILTGDGRYNVVTKEFSEVSPTELGVKYRTADGEEETRRIVYARMEGMMFGARTVTRSVRHKLIN